MKRKDVEEVSDDFSHFSLSAPASKIRRLDAEMLGAAVMDDDEMLGTAVMDDAEVDPPAPPSPSSFAPDMSIVVYKPLFDLSNSRNLPGDFSVSLHPHHISALSHLTRNQFLPFESDHPDFKSAHDQVDDETESMQRDSDGDDNCMAVVPWVAGFQPQEMEIEQEQITQTAHPLPHHHQFHCMPQHLPTSDVATPPVTWFQ